MDFEEIFTACDDNYGNMCVCIYACMLWLKLVANGFQRTTTSLKLNTKTIIIKRNIKKR